MSGPDRTVHASAVAFGALGGVLIEGPSGSGKSRLALQLIRQGAELVADDRTVVWAQDGALFARAPGPIAGLIEVRGLGLLRLAARRLARLRLVVSLSEAAPPRLPEARLCTRLGIELPWMAAWTADLSTLAAGLARALRGRAPGPALAAL